MSKLICKECGRELSLSSCKRTEDGDIICSQCASSKYRKCSNCDSYIKRTHERSICFECDSAVYRRTVNNYSTKPIPRFQSRYRFCKGIRYYGMELELNHISPEACRAIWHDLYTDKLIYNKHDGSIGSGTEVVTNPCDKASMMKLLDRMKDGMDLVKETRGYKDNAGIHFHVSRDSISPIDLYKICYLLNYTSNSKEKRIMYYLSGRNDKSTNQTDYYSYCRVGTQKNKKGLKLPSDRYNAVNLNNTSTIEFRIFKSTADIDVIKSYIELLEKIIEFSHINGIKDINISNFIVWLKNNTKCDILLRKIKNFEKYNGKFTKGNNCYKIDITMLKGISIDKYKDIIEDLKRTYSIEDVGNVLTHYKDNSSGTRYNLSRDGATPFGKGLDLTKRLEKTLKAVYISKIIKGVQSCA